jgi:FkbM family methyltransferase
MGIEVRQLALGPSVGKATLRLTRDPLASSLKPVCSGALLTPFRRMTLEEAGTVEVRQSTLDEEFGHLERILLVKLDTQGGELDILRGGARVLERTRFVLTEMSNHGHYQGGCRYYEVDALMRDGGFRLADLTVTYHTYEEGTLEFDALYEREGP